jgi:hypothetical protein
MKAAMFVGFAIGLTAAGGLTAEMPNATPGVGPVGVGAPTPLAPAPAPMSVGAPFASPVQPSRPPRRANLTQYPMTVYNPYHPHWVVEVFGR